MRWRPTIPSTVVVAVSLVGMLAARTLAQRADPGARAPADLVLRGGKVVTVDAQNRITSAVAIAGPRIVATGSDDEIARFVGPATQVVELRGRTVTPGFIDAHSHVEGLAESEHFFVPIHIPHSVKTTDEIVERLKARAAQLPAGSWIVGQGTYNQPMPSREELDRALPSHPVVLRWSAHDLLINHAAVQAADLAKVPDPKGIGKIERTPEGEPMILRDADVPLPLPRPTADQRRSWLAPTLREFYLERGVTSVYDLSSPETYAAYQDLRARGELPVRILASYRGVPSIIESGLHTGFGDDWIRLGAIKLVLDGVWGTTAATYRPAWNGSGTTWVPNNVGGTSATQEAFDRTVLDAHVHGWQVWVHANGDRAQDMVLTAYERAQQALSRPDARHRIEHFGHFLVQDPARTAERLARMRRGGIIPAPQVVFLWRLTDVNLREPDVTFFPMKTLIDMGFHPAGGSDTLGTQNFATNPMFAISVAVNRKSKFGTPVNPEEAISPMDAIRMLTIWAAYGGFEEKVKGSIEAGKLADLVVLSGDPLTIAPERIADITPELTILDGRIVHRRTGPTAGRAPAP
ncbi:MAG: amidohydrolase [Vicinamibacterales bacterium]